MKEPTTPGLNRSGMATAPLMSRQMREVTGLTTPSARGSAADALAPRIDYARDSEPAATVPPPASLKELARTAMKAIKGEKATVIVDKLGERLAFERTGVRLYEGLLAKFDVHGSWQGGPARSQLERIHGDGFRHFLMLQEAVQQLGSDPTAVTPSANIQATASMGIVQVIADPRTNLRESLEAILIIELADNDCWANLVELVRASGMDELAGRFEEAIKDEEQHLTWVREWIASGIAAAVGVTAGTEERVRQRLTAAPRTAPRRMPITKAPAGKKVLRRGASAKTRRK